MDFFGAQDRARKLSTRLIVMFVMSLTGLILVTNVLLMLTFTLLGTEQGAAPAFEFDPLLLAGSSALVIAIVALASLYKTVTLRGGGKVVAESLGGRLLVAGSDNVHEQRLLNIVEEMAIASGMPVPPVYILDEEGINAFAAGYSGSDAVIGVTRGGLMKLSREELQGVIAHEFSHILHGDMRINIRLIGLLHGILVVGMMGYYLLRSAAFARRGKNGSAVLVLAIGLIVIGAAGTFFGKLIKAAVSRQREFLADASAVQYTRNTTGIADALKRIGADQHGSMVENPAAEEISHALFGAGSKLSLSGMFATHPPLTTRIKRLQPDWNGKFDVDEGIAETVRPVSARSTAEQAADSSGSDSAAPAGQRGRAVELLLALPAAMQRIGDPDAADLDRAAQLHAALPASLLTAARSPFGARAVAYLLLLDVDPQSRADQLTHLQSHADKAVFRELQQLTEAGTDLATDLRLPLLNVALAALRQLTTGQYKIFRENVIVLTQRQSSPRLSHWLTRSLLLHHLDRAVGGVDVKLHTGGHKKIAQLSGELATVLSLLSYLGVERQSSSGFKSAQQAFSRASAESGLPDIRLLPAADLSIDRLEQSITRLQQLDNKEKQLLLAAALRCVHADEHVNAAERDLLATLAEILDTPLPAAWT